MKPMNQTKKVMIICFIAEKNDRFHSNVHILNMKLEPTAGYSIKTTKQLARLYQVKEKYLPAQVGFLNTPTLVIKKYLRVQLHNMFTC